MAKASLTLANGTSIDIEGTVKEIRELLELYGGAPARPREPAGIVPERPRSASRTDSPSSDSARERLSSPDLTEIVNLVKNSSEAESIERNILDRTSQVDRTLLPLYIVHEHLSNAFGLSSGDINRITTELGVPVLQSNASHTLSGTAAKYVMGDRVRKKGQPVRYKLSRRGVQYLKAVIDGQSNANSQ